MKAIDWKPKPKGPERQAVHVFVDAGGEHVEPIAYDVPAIRLNERLCGVRGVRPHSRWRSIS